MWFCEEGEEVKLEVDGGVDLETQAKRRGATLAFSASPRGNVRNWKPNKTSVPAAEIEVLELSFNILKTDQAVVLSNFELS